MIKVTAVSTIRRPMPTSLDWQMLDTRGMDEAGIILDWNRSEASVQSHEEDMTSVYHVKVKKLARMLWI